MQWFCEVIQHPCGKYSARMTEGGTDSSGNWHDPKRVEGLAEYVTYNELRESIRRTTGREILKRKDMIFENRCGGKYALIDATHNVGDCRVTLAQRATWKPNFT